jgi:hypothetical protein
MSQMPRSELLRELRALLREAFSLQLEGGTYTKLARSQALADGYMRALLDGGMATQRELLALVAEERAAVRGPATRADETAIQAA